MRRKLKRMTREAKRKTSNAMICDATIVLVPSDTRSHLEIPERMELGGAMVPARLKRTRGRRPSTGKGPT